MPGFEELDHTADWALRAWAPDLEGLFIQAAAGMFALMGVSVAGPPKGDREITVEGADDETLLVAFLEELLLAAELERLVLVPTRIRIEPGRLEASCAADRIERQEKEIKAVTFHDLEIRESDRGLETVLVFDV